MGAEHLFLWGCSFVVMFCVAAFACLAFSEPSFGEIDIEEDDQCSS